MHQLSVLIFNARVRDILFHYLLALTTNTTREQDNFTAQEKNLVAEAERLINADLSKHHSIEKLAAILLMSKPSFKRLFKSVKGVAPFEYLIAQRMKLAMSLLQSGHSIKQTAGLTGYGPASFTRAFRKFYNKGPGEVASPKSPPKEGI
jgi:AraC-like DNA-binding protein